VASLGSALSVLSIGSVGSIASIGSAGSIASIGSAGSVLSIGSVGALPGSRAATTTGRRRLTVVDRGATLLGLAALAAAATGR
jgi:hypothetical protein